jgi:(hydroxyamino)benzene mutase
MNTSDLLMHQGHRLLQIGVALFLFTSFEGFAIPYTAAPLLARSAHSLTALLGVILIALGLLWPRLNLAKAASQIAFWFLVYSGLAITAAFLIAGIWGAGKSTMPLAGGPMGSPFQESVITAVAYSSAPTGIIAFALILWGLRLGNAPTNPRYSRKHSPRQHFHNIEGDNPMTQQVPVIDALVDETVSMINAFTVPRDESDRFLRKWKDDASAMAKQPGFIQARMYRSLINDSELRFINVAEWASGKALALAAARKNAEWRGAVERMLDDPELHIRARPSAYELAVDVQPGDSL